MNTWDMLVETPVREADIEDRSHEEPFNQCSYCGVGPNDPHYDVRDIMVIRHWTTKSQDVREGGMWTWYCPKHFEKRNGNWWKSSHLAPARLQPPLTYSCAQRVEFGEKCGINAVEPFDGVWMCQKHAAVERMNRRIRELLDDDFMDED